MSRSIHDTWNQFRELARQRYGDRELRRAKLREMKNNLYRKRRIKDAVIHERTPDARPEEYVSPETIPIEVRDLRPGVFYPASPEDLRALLRRLPPDAFLGVRRIELCLGKERINEHVLAEGDDLAPDPLTGRSGIEEIDGVSTPAILGSRFPDGTIHLYAYVRTGEVPHWPVVELSLRKCMLSTFVHELAHHQDDMIRRSRGRWRYDDEEKVESYARRQEALWTREHVIPHLEAAHAEQVEELLAWVERHAGGRVPLAALFDLDRDLFDCFLILIRDVTEGAELPGTGVDLARYLTRNRHSASSLVLLERLLARWPNHAGLRGVEAEALLDLGRLDQAIATARVAIELESTEDNAWWALLSALQRSRAWPELLLEAERAERSLSGPGTSTPGWRLDAFRKKRALALVNLGRHAEAVAPAAEGYSRHPRAFEWGVLWVVALLGCERNAEALEACTAVQTSPSKFFRKMWSAELDACRFVAAVRLGRSDLARAYLERDTTDEKRFPPSRMTLSELFDTWVPESLAVLRALGRGAPDRA